jgi:Protein of unknown function (DUF1592)/Protein of unknown function (DUF1588)/Protein of unknown function (DUF1587)/Protein of unknown function (DUF1595)/Protein of unknown function (DUF1585)
MNRSIATLALLGGALGVGACVGSIGSKDGDEVGPDGKVVSSLCVVDTPIRRLTRFEYNNTVRDLLGDDTSPADTLPPEEEVQGFNNQAAALLVSDLLAEQYMKVAEGVSERAVLDLDTLLKGCEYQADASACADAFIADFGQRAFRRPLEASEVTRLRGLYDWAMSDPDLNTFDQAIRLVIEEVLQSPNFLYRPEFGHADPVDVDVVQLTDWEVATKLAYMIWNSMPDDTLFAAAAAGELRTPEQLDAQARRMLEDDKARDAIRNFHEQWLLLHHLDTVTKDSTVYPEYNDGLRALWKEELEQFIEYVILEDDGSMKTLLTANYTFANTELASFYGEDITEVPDGQELQRVAVDPTKRAGFLTMAAVMATHANVNQSSPVFRGKFIREQLMCDILPIPPADLVITPPDLDPSKTTREQFEEIGSNPDCASCHLLMNPIGFAFENYDGIGQWRDEQNGKTIDATGEIVFSDDLDGTFDGAAELAASLAESAQVAECVTSQWFRFAYNRSATPEDSCNFEVLNEAFLGSNFNIRELIVALTQTESFYYRHQVDPDAVPESEGGQP